MIFRFFKILFVLSISAVAFAGEYKVVDSGDTIAIEQDGVTLNIIKKGFRFSFSRDDGIVKTAPHRISGIQFGSAEKAADAESTEYLASYSNAHKFRVKTADGLSAIVTIKLSRCNAWFDILADTNEPIAITGRIAGATPGYGLSDLQANILCPKEKGTDIIPAGMGTEITGYDKEFVHSEIPLVRCVSNFAIYPKNGFAVVNIEPWAKIIKSTKEEIAQGSSQTKHITDLHYFFGTPKEIYTEYLNIRNLRGYPVMLPKYEFFGVGWEAWGALGWKTNSRTVKEDVDKYIEMGYPLRWMVLGSGFWPDNLFGKSRKYLDTPRFGTTTSFGFWDSEKYPDPNGFIKYFRDKGMKFFLGLRICFIVDGPYSEEGVEKGYFLENSNGSAKMFRFSFPRQQPVYLLDSQNPDAVKWYVDLCKKWKVDGFKEDLYGYDNYYLRDDKLNPVNEALMKEGFYIMARNNYIGSPAELQRLEDFNYDLDQDRGPINALATAYAGMPLVYPDVIGGNFGGRSFDSEVSEKVKKYLMRNAQWLSLHPSMAVGKGPWNYKDKLVEKTILDAAVLHDRLMPYFYSQAIRFYHDGYPWPMCPLPIAYYQDKDIDNRENNV
ncbi:MAG TPA: hypothetical protein DCP47_06435, partial [Phycisphaerales bacterium]|nr:hypothetical protein [Phycisphaerales bacterium]